MNQSSLQEANRKKVLKRVLAAEDGVSAVDIAKKTKLCLRTVYTHLRHFRDLGRIHNQGGLWRPIND